MKARDIRLGQIAPGIEVHTMWLNDPVSDGGDDPDFPDHKVFLVALTGDAARMSTADVNATFGPDVVLRKWSPSSRSVDCMLLCPLDSDLLRNP